MPSFAGESVIIQFADGTLTAMTSNLHHSSLCGLALPATKLLCPRSLPTRRIHAVASPQSATADLTSATDRQPTLSTSAYNASYAASQPVEPIEDLQSIAEWLRSELTRNFRDGVRTADLD